MFQERLSIFPESGGLRVGWGRQVKAHMYLSVVRVHGHAPHPLPEHLPAFLIANITITLAEQV